MPATFSGFPGDTPASIERDIRIIQRELPIDLLEFFILTPLPGSADHKKLHLAGVRDGARHEQLRPGARHDPPRRPCRTQELLGIYRKAWDIYYSPEHVETVIRRAKVWGYDPRNMMTKLLAFHAVPRIEKVHPLEGGLFRRKYRRDRRPGMPLESPFAFYPRYAWETVIKHVRFAGMYWQHWRILRRVRTRFHALHGHRDDARAGRRVRGDADVHHHTLRQGRGGEDASVQRHVRSDRRSPG